MAGADRPLRHGMKVRTCNVALYEFQRSQAGLPVLQDAYEGCEPCEEAKPQEGSKGPLVPAEFRQDLLKAVKFGMFVFVDILASLLVRGDSKNRSVFQIPEAESECR